MSFWVAGAVLVGGVASAAMASDAAGDAADQQAQSVRDSNATQLQMYNQTREDNMPALRARNASLSRLQDLLGISGNKGASGYGSLGGAIKAGDVQNEAGYQFGLQQGQSALNKQLAARGMLNSGAALKAAARYGNDYATSKYDNAFNREIANRNQQLNALQSVSGLGQTGANMIGSAGSNYANTVSSNQTALGNALGAASIARGNAYSDAINQGTGWYANNSTGVNNAVRGWWGSGGAGSMNGNGSVQGNSDYYYDI